MEIQTPFKGKCEPLMRISEPPRRIIQPLINRTDEYCDMIEMRVCEIIEILRRCGRNNEYKTVAQSCIEMERCNAVIQPVNQKNKLNFGGIVNVARAFQMVIPFIDQEAVKL